MTKTSLLALISCLPLWGACTAEARGGDATRSEPAKPDDTPTATATIENVDATAAAALLADGEEIVVLDIRTPEEYAQGHIAGAVNIDFKGEGFASELAELDRDQRYLVHCRSGGRSGRSLPQFEKLGFHSVYHLDSGLLGWIEAGQPVEK